MFDMKIEIDTAKFKSILADVENKTRIAIEQEFTQAAQRMEQEAKANAKWVDRTGDSRAGITGSVSITKTKAVIKLKGKTTKRSKGIIFLEMAHGKQWAILKPTIDKNTPIILRKFRIFK